MERRRGRHYNNNNNNNSFETHNVISPFVDFVNNKKPETLTLVTPPKFMGIYLNQLG
jgi:hypothetical protein